jgi:DUF1365 family protein
MTFKVIIGIHWEALRMWLKGMRFLGRRGQHPSPSAVREKKAAT